MTTKQIFKEEIESLYERSIFGCGNSGCTILKPIGQATNSGCTCTPRRIARKLLNMAIELEKLDDAWKEIEQ